jgi:hypothetical protein
VDRDCPEQLKVGIQTILNRDWDPIGVGHVPECVDEYDSYISGIVQLFAAGCGDTKLEQHLRQIESTNMGLDCVEDQASTQRRRKTVVALRSLLGIDGTER